MKLLLLQRFERRNLPHPTPPLPKTRRASFKNEFPLSRETTDAAYQLIVAADGPTTAVLATTFRRVSYVFRCDLVSWSSCCAWPVPNGKRVFCGRSRRRERFRRQKMTAADRDSLSEFGWLRRLAPSYSVRAENVSTRDIRVRCTYNNDTRVLLCSGHDVGRPVGVLSHAVGTKSFGETAHRNSVAVSGRRHAGTRTSEWNARGGGGGVFESQKTTGRRFQVNAIRDSMENRPDLSVRILLDANRGSRGEVSSRTMLMPVLDRPSFDCRVGNYA